MKALIISDDLSNSGDLVLLCSLVSMSPLVFIRKTTSVVTVSSTIPNQLEAAQ